MTLEIAELDHFASHPSIVQLLRSLAAHPGRVVEADTGVRRAAILLMLRRRGDGEPEVLMIKRADATGDPWSGHIALPGGRMEPADADLSATAVRETLEETGVDVARDGRLLGSLDDLMPRSPTLAPIIIRPYLALVRADVSLVPSHEVAVAFWVPLSQLRAPESWGMGDVDVRGTTRRVSVFEYGGHIVWGLTERVLRQFLSYIDIGDPIA